jgi:ACT domain-containing protein
LKNRVVLIAVGEDKPGLVAGVTSMIANAKGNIIDIDQVVLQNVFIMSILADLRESNIKKRRLKELLIKEGKKLGLKIHVYNLKELKATK